MPQTSSSHSDLGQLASQGGKAVLGSLFHGSLSEKERIQSKKQFYFRKLLKCGNLQLLNNRQQSENNKVGKWYLQAATFLVVLGF